MGLGFTPARTLQEQEYGKTNPKGIKPVQQLVNTKILGEDSALIASEFEDKVNDPEDQDSAFENIKNFILSTRFFWY